MNLKYISARTVKNSDSKSTEFMSLNNCGAFIDTDKPIVTNRPDGRMDFQLIYIKKGAIEFTENGAKSIACGGSVILFRPREPQKYRTAEDGTTFYWVHFSGSEAEKLLDFFVGRALNVGNFVEFEEFCNDAARAFASGAENCQLYSVGRLLSLIALLSQKVGKSDAARMREMLEPAVLDMHTYFEVARSNDEYASLCGLSKAHFIRTFHSVFGVPPQKYRTGIIMREAKHLLKGGMSVGDVADSLGFADRFYFSRLFKKYFGTPPKEYK